MGFGLMTAGFILLFNPVIMFPVFGDILPDAVGFFLIAAGLTRLSSFIGKLAEARDGFLKLAFLEMGKFVAMLALVRASGTAKPLVVIPGCMLGGGVFCMVCDVIARLAFAPTELNISTVTAVFGAPVVIYMMVSRRSQH